MTTKTKTKALNVSRFSTAFDRATVLATTAGPCELVRTIAIEFADLPRKDVLTIAGSVGVNLGTASRQFQEARAGKY